MPDPDRKASMSEHPVHRGDGSETAGSDYAQRLQRLEGARWKKLLDVQRPYRWNLRRLGLGRVLDVGCGIGRNLANLGPDSVGVDHNADSVAAARARGLTAYTTQEFWDTEVARPGSFDSLLLAHVMEHVDADVADGIVREYLPCLRPRGKVVLITPQEVGFRSDATHVRFVDLAGLDDHAQRLGLAVDRAYSFPFPRPAGRVFKYNEFVLVASVPGA
ncbi:class I SAM-dependent methyltransferase [Phycicoccus sp. M110.8]|uniref:class I SAM-dependent methyltransferase n=1 Tax=Phycicoccus sp. M110.8 TaxID=3075433 RepID=UPI0028FD8B01|nr:class I SAM-dependent methyltransferase [Phycicoccus sp. M110.8]MDU0312717.1 class I SAM-dependent methyltransferase [Phycicoccus sp. M110.8]